MRSTYQRVDLVRPRDRCQDREPYLSRINSRTDEEDILDRWHTSWPVQNIGHLSHGFSLALVSQRLRYGLRTISGSTGGVSLDALVPKLIKARTETVAARSRCMTVLVCRLKVLKNGQRSLSRQSIITVAVSLQDDHGTCPATPGPTAGMAGTRGEAGFLVIRSLM